MTPVFHWLNLVLMALLLVNLWHFNCQKLFKFSLERSRLMILLKSWAENRPYMSSLKVLLIGFPLNSREWTLNRRTKWVNYYIGELWRIWLFRIVYFRYKTRNIHLLQIQKLKVQLIESTKNEFNSILAFVSYFLKKNKYIYKSLRSTSDGHNRNSSMLCLSITAWKTHCKQLEGTVNYGFLVSSNIWKPFLIENVKTTNNILVTKDDFRPQIQAFNSST